MKVAYVAGPYRGPTEYQVHRNIQEAEAIALELWRIGFAVICPHKNSGYFGGEVSEDLILEGCLKIVEKSDCIVMMYSWERSEGSTVEREFALQHSVPVYYWPQDKAKLIEFLSAE